MKKVYLIMALSAFILGCKETKKTEIVESNDAKETTASVEKSSDWEYLFDGTSTDGWRSYNGTSLPDGWVIEEDMLKSLGKGGDIGGDIVYDKEQYGEFEISIEWKISEGGNSGLFYHVIEDEKYDAPYYNAPEYQMIDQIGFPQKLEPWQSLGADYGMYNPDYEGAIKKAGEWNTTRIVFTNEKVEYWLNGKMTVSFVPWSDDWKERKESGKWKDFPDYGKAKSGYIGLQDHGSYIWFKNIKVRKL
ncbi:3-keto-disaccharide hydrolase [Joostella sp.]|uniref:3-keto-disaccharide hydrolase n=1 Tax=Joostella sp. TaxID=2231138 RepID=UPI003A918FFE